MNNNHKDTSPKHHCMIVHAYYPLGETRVQREAEALLDAGYKVDIICIGKPIEVAYEIVDKATVYRLPVQRAKRGFGRQLVEYLRFMILAASRA